MHVLVKNSIKVASKSYEHGVHNVSIKKINTTSALRGFISTILDEINIRLDIEGPFGIKRFLKLSNI
jgi:hypothetical protein